jgi:uroporphyrinogen-III synthase
MMPIIAIRPEPGCEASVRALTSRGLFGYGFPLFTIEPLEWSGPHPDGIDALLIGSANAIRHGGDALVQYLGKPVYAVGMATANEARQAGFAVIAIGEGDLQSLMGEILPHHRRLLRLAGRRRVVLDPPEHIALFERVVYAAVPLPLPPALEQLLAEPCVVLLHSAEAARHLAGLCTAHEIDRSRIALAAIGPRVAMAAGDGWARVASAAKPNEQALLALAEDLCQNALRS